MKWGYVLPVIAVVVSIVAVFSVNVVGAQQSYPTYSMYMAAPWYYTLLPPWPAPWWNPFATGNILFFTGTWMPIADFEDPTGQWWPVLAKSWTVFPQNHTLIIYFRHDLYWFNGTAVIPFTAWDAYAWFYISDKVFGDWESYGLMPQNADKDFIIIDNYTLSIHFDYWTNTGYYWLLMSWVPNTPWPVWEKVVEELKTMSVTQAQRFSNNITSMVVPYWGLSPYYVTKVSSGYVTVQLEPEYFNGKPLLATWNKILPFHTWQYYPTITINIGLSGGLTQEVSLAIQTDDYFIHTWYPSLNFMQVLESHGYSIPLIPDISIEGIAIPTYYPFNIPQVRQAFLYIINRTEDALAWGAPQLITPVYINVPAPEPNVVPGLWLTFPEDIRAMVVNFTQPNWTKAAQLLESAGLYYKNGQWYLPNGTPLTLTLYANSGAHLAWLKAAQVDALALTEFGIKTTLVTVESSTYSTEITSCQLPNTATDWFYAGSNKGGVDESWIYYDYAYGTAPALYPSAWCIPGRTTPFAYPIVQNGQITGWYCKPLVTNLPIPNNTIITCVNSTFGYFNFSNWESAISAAMPGSSAYYDLVKAYFAWFEYWVPGVEQFEAQIAYAFPSDKVDPMWAYQCLNVTNPKYTRAAYAILHNWAMGWGWDGLYPGFNTWLFMGAFAPPGQIPPLAQAIINGSLWTRYPQYAAFIGLPTPDPELQACVASYFHTTYTPVTTSTTTTTTTTTATTTAVSTVTSTTTVTSTVTSTSVSTTTAVSTVTVTKPVISTALIAGIVIIVVVIAAVAAIIALRRR